MGRKLPECSAAHRQAGVPGGGGYATARAVAAFYQMLAQGGRLGDVRIVSPRTIQYVTQNFTGERLDRDGAPALLESARCLVPWLRHVFADDGYAGNKLKDALKGHGE